MEFYIAGLCLAFIWVVYASAIAVRWVRENNVEYWDALRRSVDNPSKKQVWYPEYGWRVVAEALNNAWEESDGLCCDDSRPLCLAAELPLAFLYAPLRGAVLLLRGAVRWIVWPTISAPWRLWAWCLTPLLNRVPEEGHVTVSKLVVPYGSIVAPKKEEDALIHKLNPAIRNRISAWDYRVVHPYQTKIGSNE